MAFPAYGTSVPTLTPLEFNYNGVTFGGLPIGTYTQFVSLTGLDLPPIDSGDVQRPLNNGEFAGYDVSKGRDIIITCNIWGSTAAGLDTARAAIAAAFQPQGNTEIPLWIQTGGGTTYVVVGRVRKYNWKYDLNMVQVFGDQITIAFHATDWRVYGTPTSRSATTFGTSASPNTAIGGVVAQTPLITITAGTDGCSPVVIAAVSSVTLIDLDFSALAMAVGDTLTIDTDFQTALWFDSSASVTSSVVNLLNFTTGMWGPLPAGQTANWTVTDVSGGGSVNNVVDIDWANSFSGV